MEDRLAETAGQAPRPGLALIALGAILAITAAWWALALWPAAAEPEWLARTRAACFGSERGGLPDAGGWVLLIGEPIGMLVALLAIGGRSLRRDIAWLGASPVRRLAAVSVTGLAVVATAALGVRVARAWEAGRSPYAADLGSVRRVAIDAPGVTLVDQHGRRMALGDLRGGPAILTFTFGHCTTVCPVIVNDLRAARRRARRDDVPLVIITLDPWRDTPERLPTLAAHWQLAPGDRVLSGAIEEVEAALDALGIARRRNGTTGDIDHATTVFVLDREGRIGWRGDGGAGGVGEVLGEL